MRQEDSVLLLGMMRYIQRSSDKTFTHILPDETPGPGRRKQHPSAPRCCPQIPRKHKTLLPQCGDGNLLAKHSEALLKAGRTSQALTGNPRMWNWATPPLKHADNQSCCSSFIKPSKRRSNGNEGLFSLEVWLQPLPFRAADIVLPRECGNVSTCLLSSTWNHREKSH